MAAPEPSVSPWSCSPQAQPRSRGVGRGHEPEPKVVEVTTDTPLESLSASPHHPGAPVNPGPHRVRQPDGTRITVTAWGDSRTTG